MYGLDMINTSVLGALGCDMNTFLRYFPAAETMYSLLVALAIGLILLGWVWNLFKNYGLGLGIEAEDPVKEAGSLCRGRGFLLVNFLTALSDIQPCFSPWVRTPKPLTSISSSTGIVRYLHPSITRVSSR